MRSDESLECAAVDIDFPEQEIADRVYNSLFASDEYQLKPIGPTDEHEDSYKLINENVDGTGNIDSYSVCQRFRERKNANEKIDQFLDIVGHRIFDEHGSIKHIYDRKLPYGQERIKSFALVIKHKLKNMGYSVTFECDSGALVSPDGDCKRQRRLLFYIMKNDSLIPHLIQFYYGEDGIHMSGQVTEDFENKEKLRQIITEFSI
jgi:hypothetical protein